MYVDNGNILESMASIIIKNNKLVKNGRGYIKVNSLYVISGNTYAKDEDGNMYEIHQLPYNDILSLYRPRNVPKYSPDSILFIDEYFDFLQHIA